MHSMHTLIFRLHQCPFISLPWIIITSAVCYTAASGFKCICGATVLGCGGSLSFPWFTAPGCFQTFGKGAEALNLAPMTKDPNLNERSGYVLQQNPSKKKNISKRPTANVPTPATPRPIKIGQNNGGGIDGASITGEGGYRSFPKGSKVVGASIIGSLKVQSFTSKSSCWSV